MPLCESHEIFYKLLNYRVALVRHCRLMLDGLNYEPWPKYGVQDLYSMLVNFRHEVYCINTV